MALTVACVECVEFSALKLGGRQRFVDPANIQAGLVAVIFDTTNVSHLISPKTSSVLYRAVRCRGLRTSGVRRDGLGRWAVESKQSLSSCARRRGRRLDSDNAGREHLYREQWSRRW